MIDEDKVSKGQLHIVRAEREADDAASDPGPVPEAEAEVNALEAGARPSDVVGTAVAHAAMCWVACCHERQGITVTVSPLGGGMFDAEVSLVGGGSLFVRVTLDLSVGPRLRTLVEPIHP